MSETQLLTPIPGTQERLGGISRTTVYELAKRGDIHLVNIGRRAFITTQSLEEYVARLSKQSGEANA